MATLLFKRQKKIGVIEIDTFTTETHGLSSNVTKYPVENGSEIIDHITPNPDTFSGEAIVMPITVIGPDLSKNRANDAYKELKRINVEKELVTIITGLVVYSNMHISSISIPRNTQNGTSLVFNITASRVRFANSQTTTIPRSQLNPADANQAQNTADTGVGTNGQTQSEETQNDFLAEAAAVAERVDNIVFEGGA